MGKEKDFSRNAEASGESKSYKKSGFAQLSDDENLQGFKDADARIVKKMPHPKQILGKLFFYLGKNAYLCIQLDVSSNTFT